MTHLILEHSEAAVGLLSLIVIVVSAYAGFKVNQRRERRSHTLNVFMQFSTNENLAEADAMLAERLSTEEPIREPETPELGAALMQMLDHYELIATAYRLGILDRVAVRHLRGGAMCRAYRLAEPYILDRREGLVRPELYGDLEVATLKLGRIKA